LELPWGDGPFPYPCGITLDGFLGWYLHRESYTWELVPDPAVLRGGHDFLRSPAEIVNLFCVDCAPGFRRKAQDRGACRFSPVVSIA
jgi:hypothetical protein